MSITIEAGKSYRANNGEKWVDARPNAVSASSECPWRLTDENGKSYAFTSDGRFYPKAAWGRDCDLVAEWTDAPQPAPEVTKALADALEPFARQADDADTGAYPWQDEQHITKGIKVGDLRRARAVLALYREARS